MLPVLLMTLINFESVSGIWTLDSLQLIAQQESPTMVELPYVWALFAVGAVAMLLNLIDLFLYKNRVLQMRIASYTIWVLLGFCGYLGWLCYDLSSILDSTVRPSVVAGLPLVSMIFNYLAIRNIAADEMLVRSLDRLR